MLSNLARQSGHDPLTSFGTQYMTSGGSGHACRHEYWSPLSPSASIAIQLQSVPGQAQLERQICLGKLSLDPSREGWENKSTANVGCDDTTRHTGSF